MHLICADISKSDTIKCMLQLFSLGRIETNKNYGHCRANAEFLTKTTHDPTEIWLAELADS